MKLSAHHMKDMTRSDIVTRRAEELHINPEEVFARAFLAAGKARSTSIVPFSRYCKGDGSDHIPDEVRRFCEQPLPTCSNPACPDPKKPATFSRIDSRGAAYHFCSLRCMDATPRVESKAEDEMTSVEGMKILERVRIAMSSATFVKVSPSEMRSMAGQPRVYFSPERMQKMVESLKSVGQMTPGIIRSVPANNDGVKYEICDGERRWRGITTAGLGEYRAMLVEIDDEAAPYVVSIIANFNREEHTLVELADSVQKMHEGLKLTMYQIGRVLGIPYTEASKLYGLRRLVPEVRDMLDPNLTKSRPLPKLAAIRISQEPTEKQVAYAKKLMSKELTVGGLKEHLRREAAGHGVILPKRNLGPEERRGRVKARVHVAKNNSEVLADVLSEGDTLVALQEFPLSFLQKLAEDLKSAQENMARCQTRLSEAIQMQK